MMGYWTHELQEPVHLIPLNLEISIYSANLRLA